jgi:NodT family efflux transporter outer membrane factor (OMF) lipoprotein
MLKHFFNMDKRMAKKTAFHFWRFPLLGLILLLAHGCVRVPKHDMATSLDSLECNQAVATALESTLFSQDGGPKKSWWEGFGDPTLNRLIESALQSSPTLKRAEASLKAAQQFALQKRAALYPEINFDASTDWQHLAKDGFFRAFAPTIPAVVNDITLGLSYVYEFDFWGKNRDRFKAALGLASALAAERMQAELILTTSIAYTYADLQFLLRKRSLLEQMEINRGAVAQVRTQRKIGALDNALEGLTADSTALEKRASVIEVDEAIDQMIHKLKSLSALGQDAPLEIFWHPLEPLTLSLPPSLSLDLIARRPDLSAQKARIEAAAKEVKAAKTDFYPNVNLMGLVGLESVFWSKLFQRRNYDGFIEPAIHLPVFTAGRLKAQLKEKVADFNEAVFKYNELILSSAQEVTDRISDLIHIQKEIAVREKQLSIAKEDLVLRQQRFEYALDNQLNLLEAQNNVLEKELMLADLEYGKQLEAILLIRALGGGYHE